MRWWAVFLRSLSATHEADHRFTVEGFVCGADGKSSANIDVLVKDTRISYGQIVKTDGEGYYKAAFHLHNDNLGDSLLIEAKGQQQEQKVSFDPKDLEAERGIQVNFGTGCIHDRNGAPLGQRRARLDAQRLFQEWPAGDGTVVGRDTGGAVAVLLTSW